MTRHIRLAAARSSRGFTLLELVMVLVIIGVILAMVGPRVFNSLGRASSERAKVGIEQRGTYMGPLELLTGLPSGDPEASTWPAETVYGRVAQALEDLERVTRQAAKGPEKAKAAPAITGPTEGGPTEGGPDVP